MAKSDPDRVTRDTASFLGTGLGKAHSTTVHKGKQTYTGNGCSRDEADKKAGEKIPARREGPPLKSRRVGTNGGSGWLRPTRVA